MGIKEICWLQQVVQSGCPEKDIYSLLKTLENSLIYIGKELLKEPFLVIGHSAAVISCPGMALRHFWPIDQSTRG